VLNQSLTDMTKMFIVTNSPVVWSLFSYCCLLFIGSKNSIYFHFRNKYFRCLYCYDCDREVTANVCVYYRKLTAILSIFGH